MSWSPTVTVVGQDAGRAQLAAHTDVRCEDK